MRITCGLKPSENGFLGLKVTISSPIRRKIPMTNPHRSLKIRTIESESTRLVENPHDLPEINTTGRKSARPSFCATDRERPLCVLCKRFTAAGRTSATTPKNRPISPIGDATHIDYLSTRILNRWNSAIPISGKRSVTQQHSPLSSHNPEKQAYTAGCGRSGCGPFRPQNRKSLENGHFWITKETRNVMTHTHF